MVKPVSGISTRTEEQALLDPKDSSELGARNTIESDVYFDGKDIKFTTVPWNRGLTQLFVELLANSVDNFNRDTNTEWYSKQTYIHVTIDSKTNILSIENDGTVIPIYPNTQGLYDASIAFSVFRSGSGFGDFNKNKEVSSTYGYGAKTTNTFSKEFKVTIADSHYGKLFTQVWQNNKSKTDGPVIKSYRGQKSYTNISYLVDFNRLFDQQGNYLKPNYSSYDISMIRLYLIGASLFTRLKVILIVDGVKETFPVTWKPMIKLFNPARSVSLETPELSMLLIESPDNEFHQISYVDGVLVPDGGTQVTYIMNKLLDTYKTMAKVTIGKTEFQKYFCLITSLKVAKPKYDTKFKGRFTGTNTFVLTLDKTVKSILLWPFASELNQSKVSDNKTKIEKENTKRSRTHKILKHIQVNGWPKPKGKPILDVCEGDSASQFCLWGMVNHGNSDVHGIYKLGGKIMNLMTNSDETVLKNQTISDIKAIINIEFNVEYVDKSGKVNQQAIDKLIYKEIWIATDQDSDGFHIGGLLITALNVINKSILLVPGFLKYNPTPLIIANGIPYYSKKLYEDDVNKGTGKAQYYKGLGGFNQKDALKYYASNLMNITWLSTSQKAITLLFSSVGTPVNYVISKNNVLKDRKDLSNYFIDLEDKSIDYSKKYLTVDEYMIKNVGLYQYDDNIRAIPSLIDGFKESHRKIIHTMLKNPTTRKKVAQIAGNLADTTNYAHGEASTSDTIIKMAQTYAGSNNINLLYPDGNFGTIIELGKNASSPRYIYTKLEDVTRFIIRKEDDIILKYKEEEGKLIEPESYFPIIPLIFMFNVTGIGMGYSCNIPSLNPLDIIDYLKDFIVNGESNIPLIPWYRGFTGSIVEQDGKYYSEGRMKTQDTKTTIVQELPIDVSYSSFKDALDEAKGLIDPKKTKKEVVPSIDNYTFTNLKNDIQEFTIKHSKPLERDILKYLKNSIISNLTVFDTEGLIYRYDNVYDMIEEFIDYRMTKYEERHKEYIKVLEREYQLEDDKYRFISSVVSNKFTFKDKSKQDFTDFFVEQGYQETSHDSIFKIPTIKYNKEELNKLNKSMANLKDNLDKYNNTLPRDIWINELDVLYDILDKTNQY